jgi:hypothetical protein
MVLFPLLVIMFYAYMILEFQSIVTSEVFIRTNTC